MGAKIKKTVAEGIYLLTSGAYRVKVAYGDRRRGQSREKQFKAGTDKKVMQAWQAETLAALMRSDLRPAKDTLAADVERYLVRADVQGLVSYKTRCCDVRAWLPTFGHMRRHEIKEDAISEQLARWVQEGVAAYTVRHRLNALRQVGKKLDGENAYNPAARVRGPRKPNPIPRALDYFVIRTTLNQMEPSVTKAVLMIMAFCGFRPSEIRATEPDMLVLDGDDPRVIRNTAKGGDPTALPLKPEALLAWRMFSECGGFGAPLRKTCKGTRPTFPNHNRDWKQAMQRARESFQPTDPLRALFEPVNSYRLVHSFCRTLHVDGDAEITVVQKARGHKDVRTTMIYTTMKVDPRLRPAMQRAFGGLVSSAPLRTKSQAS